MVICPIRMKWLPVNHYRSLPRPPLMPQQPILPPRLPATIWCVPGVGLTACRPSLPTAPTTTAVPLPEADPASDHSTRWMANRCRCTARVTRSATGSMSKDHARALYTVGRHRCHRRTYNIGGHNEKQNLDVVHTICDLLDGWYQRPAPTATKSPVADRPGLIAAMPSMPAR